MVGDPGAHEPEPDAAGFVLAGGQSTRMGKDKALVEFRGQPLMVHALGILRGARLAPSIAGARSDLGAYAPVVHDLDSGQGPLDGICNALSVTLVPLAIFIPVDLPLLPAPLIAFLLHHARVTGRAVTVTSVTGFSQTFPVVLNRAVLPILKSELDAGRRGCYAAFHVASAALGQPTSVLATEFLVQSGQVSHADGLPPALWFLNINSAGNLRRARQHRPGRFA